MDDTGLRPVHHPHVGLIQLSRASLGETGFPPDPLLIIARSVIMKVGMGVGLFPPD